MDTTQFVGAERLSQVLQSIKQAGGSGMPPLNTLVDKKTIDVDYTGKLFTPGHFTGHLQHINESEIDTLDYDVFYSNGILAISNRTVVTFADMMLNTVSLPQPTEFWHLDYNTIFTPDEVYDWVDAHSYGTRFFPAILLEAKITYEQDWENAWVITQMIMDLSPLINSENQ
jgi:hypothetical protein